jgi:UDP-GlcNAc:undecaprenyl-phosphate/decaprenyl-phosphate GlcNAc-1-phosphate transferase
MTIVWLSLAAGLSVYIITPLAIRLAPKFGLVDDPTLDRDRRIHKRTIPLVGGTVIGIVILVTGAAAEYFGSRLTGPFLSSQQLIFFAASVFIIVIGGIIDDKYKLPWYLSICSPLMAAGLIVWSGAGVNFVTNPLGGVIRLDSWRIPISLFGSEVAVFKVWAHLFAFAWLMTMMYTTKILDGLDGLVSGLTGISAIILVILSLRPPVLQPDTALVAALVAAAFLGFLPWNWSPARAFLGEGGSLLAGLSLGFLSIVAGGKIATTLLVMGIPALDLIIVLLRRLFVERRPLSQADLSHLHFRLLQSGFTTRQAVLFLYSLGAFFGLIALTSQTFVKTASLAILAMVLWVCLFFTRRRTT